MTDPTKSLSPALTLGQETPIASALDKTRHASQRESEGTLPPSTEPDAHEKPPSISLSPSSSGRDSQDDRSHSLSRTVSEVRDGIANWRDPELGPLEEPGEKEPPPPSEHDPNLVTWDGPADPQNPKQWQYRKKWAAVVVVSCFTFISPVSSTMIAPALASISEDLQIPTAFEASLIMSVFVLAYAVGPLTWGPLSELYGRVVVLQLTNLLYLVFNLGCGLARTKEQLAAFRFFAGLGGSAPLALGGGVLSDLFLPEQRGKAMSIYSLTPLLGPAIGPIAGGYISERTSWRWIFHATTIADALIQCMGLFLLRETYAPVLLGRKKARLIRETGNAALHTEYDHPDRTIVRTLSTALTRPFRLLATQPIVQVLALYMMFLYGCMYLVTISFPTLWSDVYHESVGTGGLNYIALGVGFFLGAQICAPLQDRIYAYLKRRLSSPGRPEFRVPMMVPGALLVPLGLLIYGWTAQRPTHWIGPDIGAALFSCGTIIGFQCVQGFLVDTYPRYAASAVGAATVLRSLAGFGFPLFAPYLFQSLDYGLGSTVIAAVGIVIGWPTPFLLWKFGEKLRKRSPYASGGER